MLDVGQCEFLVLLFMTQAQDDSPRNLFIDGVREQFLDSAIDVCPECDHLFERWTRER